MGADAPEPAARVTVTPAVFQIMVALADGELHGYGIMQDVDRVTNGETKLGPGTLYRSIQRMVVDGLIEELDIALDGEVGRRPPPLLPLDGSRPRRRHRRGKPPRAARRRGPRAPAHSETPWRQAMTRAPEDFQTITPQLVVNGVGSAIAWYSRALGANELLRNLAPDGTSVMHAELLLGHSRFFVVDEFPDGAKSPRSLGGTAVTLHLYVEDVDTLFDRAVAAGAEVVLPVADQFWGDRYGMLADPFGHRWSIASRIEDLSPKALQERAATWAKENANA